MATATATALIGSRWPDLPPDLLGLVLLSTPSHADRVRLRAVCRSWRSSAQMLQPLLPPLLPWAALRDGTFVSLPDGVVHRLHVPDDVCLRFSTGGMLLLVHRDDRYSLMHPQSGDLTPQWINPDFLHWSRAVPVRPDNILLPRRPHDILKVVVVSERIVAVRSSSKGINVRLYSRGGAGTREMHWMPPKNCRSASDDIAMFQGKLYLLTARLMWWHYELHVIDVTSAGEEQDGIRSVQCIRSTAVPRCPVHGSVQYLYYLVASGDRLLMIEQTIEENIRKRTLMPPRFEVFEAADLSSGHGRWSKTDTLMGRALFLSADCSESLPADNGVDGAPKEDCIYFMTEKHSCHRSESIRELKLVCGVYSMRQGTTTSLFSSAMPSDGPMSPTWFFPTET